MGKNNRQRRAAKARQKAQARTGAPGRAPGNRGDAGYGNVTWGAFEPLQPAPERSATPGEEAMSLIAAGLGALDYGHHEGADAAGARLAQLATTSSGRGAVTTTLTGLLTDCVTTAWQRGWQPADVHRFAGRVFGPAEQDLLGDAMAHELSRYAKHTVEARWHDQLSEVSAATWWGQDMDLIQARSAVSDGGLASLVVVALHVLHLLATLPPLEVLDPLPGTALPDHGVQRRAAEVDGRVLARVRMLLAKAESTPFEAEAETFTAGAQALMARHSIDVAMLAAAGGPGGADTPKGRRIGIDRPYERPKVLLLSVVADANRCRTVWSESLGFVTVVGFASDLQAVETLFTSLLLQSTRAMRSEGSRTHRTGQSRTRAFRQSFLTAFAHRIGQRLQSVTEQETAAAQERAGGGARAELDSRSRARARSCRAVPRRGRGGGRDVPADGGAGDGVQQRPGGLVCRGAGCRPGKPARGSATLSHPARRVLGP